MGRKEMEAVYIRNTYKELKPGFLSRLSKSKKDIRNTYKELKLSYIVQPTHTDKIY